MNIGHASRSRLLGTVSSMALVVSICASGPALADERPNLWLEIGWDIENVHDSVNNVPLPLGPMIPTSGITSPLTGNLNFDNRNTNDAKITFQPDGSDWIFSASIRYGRSRLTTKDVQTGAPVLPTSFISYQFTYPIYPSYNRARTRSAKVRREHLSGDMTKAESHFILDFEAGKDVGLGMFGRGSTSVLSAGVRFAHFAMSRHVSQFQETQGIHFQSFTFETFRYPGYGVVRHELWDVVSANNGVSASFAGLGPSVKWEASAPLWGNAQSGIAIDWGADAAILFGKQQRKTHYQSSSVVNCYGDNCAGGLYYNRRFPNAGGTASTIEGHTGASRTVAVPNVGGFVGLSLKTTNAKLSLGYRADLFMNAMDVGLDTRKSSNLLFHGPYASISIGVSD